MDAAVDGGYWSLNRLKFSQITRTWNGDNRI